MEALVEIDQEKEKRVFQEETACARALRLEAAFMVHTRI